MLNEKVAAAPQQDKRTYVQCMERWYLKRFSEYGMLLFAIGMTLGLLVLELFSTLPEVLGGDLSRMSNPFILLYLLLSVLYCAAVSVRLRREIIRDHALSRSSRLLALPLILLGLCGNIFLLISGLYLLASCRNIEYNLAVFAFAGVWLTLLVSLLNIFKAYVNNYFFMGAALLIGIALFLAVVLCLLAHQAKQPEGSRWPAVILPIALILIALTASGNLFALLLGLILLAKYRRQKEQRSSAQWIDVVTRLFRNNMSLIGLLFVVFLISISIMSALMFEEGMALENDYAALFITPNLEHPFGTDNYGRDVFTRIVMGAKISLIVGVMSTLVPVIFGGMLGASAGYFGGKFDNLLMRVLDILYAVPGMLLAIAVVAAFGANTFNLVMALSLSGIPSYARIVRATVMSVANNEFVEAAVACGASHPRIILRHIIPNSLAPLIVNMTLGIGGAVLSTSALSYLGLGVEPHVPEWGNILKIGSAYLETQPYLAVIPGLAIILILLAFNFFGDGLRDALDPKMK